MSSPDPILVARGATDCLLLPQMANRHGLIAGATGTGKTITLQVLAEGFSRIGVPVFLADVKGDLAGLSQPGAPNPRIQERVAKLELEGFDFAGCPVTFWDVLGENGHPVRATVSEMGPLLIARLLGLNETQEGVLHLAFKIADENGLLILDLKDLRALLGYLGENAAAFTTTHGNISAASVGAIQRGLTMLEQQGGERFFAEPALNLDDLIQTDAQGRGVVNILSAERLMQSPRVYATFLLWLLSELFENLPEVGDLPQPKLVFFFDEAHLLFGDAPPALLEKIEQVVRLVRSKGVGIYFVTQNPIDIPDRVLGQLSNRVQHALRAFTPRDQKAVRAAAETFRPNPAFATETAVTELGVGEALVSLLDERGQPGVVERALICPPRSQIGPIRPDQRRALMQSSLVAGVYEKVVDRESAYERLAGAHAQRGPGAAPAAAPGAPTAPAEAKRGFWASIFGWGSSSSPPVSSPTLPTAPRGGYRGGRQTEGLGTALAKSAARTIGNQVGREIIRGVLGSIFGGSRRRR